MKTFIAAVIGTAIIGVCIASGGLGLIVLLLVGIGIEVSKKEKA
jgi:hypothetical protein